MIIRIDHASTVPGYRQIADQIRAFLVEGALKPGDKLPTVRELAMDLGVHFNTVAGAYRTLADEDWIELGRRRGAVVLDRKTPSAPAREVGERELGRLRQLVAALRSSGIKPRRLAAELRAITEELEELP